MYMYMYEYTARIEDQHSTEMLDRNMDPAPDQDVITAPHLREKKIY
jgi:hypothetical protein